MNKVTRLLLGITVLVGIGLVPVLTASVVHAINAADFQPGRIIDDEVFYNKSAMGSAAEVQSFIKSHTPSTCDTWGTAASGYGNLTNAQYAQQIKGWPGPPYVCLQNYYENPTTGETSFEKGGGAFDGGLSAAQIIYDASQQYTINPEVLLVLLRKESLNLYGDAWPMKSQYTYAMGYACPDSGVNYSANCNPTKAGFYKQVFYAAWQLRYYYDHMGSYNYAPGRINTIQYSPDPACGTKDVYIQNYATASLYIYTPYTPNDASLNAYPGTATCGSYGNRNFWFMWQEWFGSPYGHVAATPLKVTSSDTLGQRFTGDKITVSFTAINESKAAFTYQYIGIAGRDPDGGNLDSMSSNVTLQPGEKRTFTTTVTPTKEGNYQFFLSSWLVGDTGWQACKMNLSESTCFDPYVVQAKPIKTFAYVNATTSIRAQNALTVNYTVTNPSSTYTIKDSPTDVILWVGNGGGIRGRWIESTGQITPGSTVSKSYSHTVPPGNWGKTNLQLFNGLDEVVLPLLDIKPEVTLTQGLTLSDPSPHAKTSVVGSFKVKNFSDHAVSTNDQLCYIIRDTATNGNHDFGCMAIGTLQPGQELTFSRSGSFTQSGQYHAVLAIYNGTYWRPFDTYLPETGVEKTTLDYTVRPQVTLTQGMTISASLPREGESVTGSFKLKNSSDQAYSTNDQLCYIIRDTATNGNHDFGCMAIGTLQPGQELTFSRSGHFTTAGHYKAFFAIYNGTYWRPFDTYLPETGVEKTAIEFDVKPAISLTQGLSLSEASPHALSDVTGSFKIKNFSNVAISRTDQLCYIVRDIPETGAHDFGCMAIGTLQPGQELTFSQLGHFSHPGKYKAWFAIYDGVKWRPFDTYYPETGSENTTLEFTVKPQVTLIGGLSLSNANPSVNVDVTGSFKLKNSSDQAYSTNDQLCYIIRDTATNGNHDFGCMAIGTLQPGQELTFSRSGHFTTAGHYKAFFAIYNGTYWRPFDTYLPETGVEKTAIEFDVKT